MATPPILFSYKNDYKSLPIITPEASATIQEVTEVEKSENVPEDPTANVLEESCLDDSRPLKLAWPTSKHTPFGTKLNFTLENDTPVPEQEDAIFDAHLNAFQLPGTSTAASKKDDALKKSLRSNSHNSSIRCVCGTKYACLVHLKVPGINAPQSNLSADDLPITSHDETLIETPPLDSNSISMHFSHEMKTMLCAIFGEPETETDLAESSEVEVPIWICQQLYNAWKKQPVMENPMDIITKQDEALGLQDEEIARLLCKELNGFEVGYGQPPLAFAQNNMASHLTLQLLHEKYDKYFNPNIVEDIYRGCNNNFQLAADTLQGIINDQKRGPQYPKIPEGPYLKVVKSAAPSAIHATPRAQEEPIIPLPTWPGKLQGEELKEHVHYLRQKALGHINARNNLYARAQEVYADKKKRAAAFVYSDMAREHHYQAENIQNEVVNNMLYHTQKDRTLDLHFMTVDKALLALRTKLKFMKQSYPYVKELEVITGYGKSMNNAAKIKPAVENWLFQKNINFRALNPGSVAVNMKSVTDNL